MIISLKASIVIMRMNWRPSDRRTLSWHGWQIHLGVLEWLGDPSLGVSYLDLKEGNKGVLAPPIFPKQYPHSYLFDLSLSLSPWIYLFVSLSFLCALILWEMRISFIKLIIYCLTNKARLDQLWMEKLESSVQNFMEFVCLKQVWAYTPPKHSLSEQPHCT